MSNCSRHEKTVACFLLYSKGHNHLYESGPWAKEIQNRFHLVEYEQYVSYITQNVVGFIYNTPPILEELTIVLYIAVGGYQSNPVHLVQLLCHYTALKWTGDLPMNLQNSIKNIFSYLYNQAELSPSPGTCPLIHFTLFSSSALEELIEKIALRCEPAHQFNQMQG